MANTPKHVQASTLQIIDISFDVQVKGIDDLTFNDDGVDAVIQSWRMVTTALSISV